MGRQRIKITTTKKIRNSQTTVDINGRRHCKTCGAYVGKKGRK